MATKKLVDAANSVGNPDIGLLHISLEGSIMKDAVSTAILKAPTERRIVRLKLKHPSVRCDSCNQNPLRGFRIKCSNCSNYDLCTKCYTDQIHYLDHPLLRVTDSTGTGDLLIPRLKGGGIFYKTTMVGTKAWKGILLRVLLDFQGYIIYNFESRHERLDTANTHAQHGFLVTIAH